MTETRSLETIAREITIVLTDCTPKCVDTADTICIMTPMEVLMNTQHTPGPWMIYDTGDIGSASVRTEDHTVIRAGNVKGATIGEATQNARLIAASPELLAALQELYALRSTVMNAASKNGRKFTGPTDHFAEPFERARAAIAKTKVFV